MYRALTTFAFAALMTGSALAAGPACSTADAAKFKPQADLEALIKADGLTLKKVKVEKGCYEVYAVDKAGKKVNVAYNAETLEKVDNPEAGEN
jgi:hypothetical protein